MSRLFRHLLVCTVAVAVSVTCFSATLPAWTPGTLDIHQISTGRGNAALIIGPDGTSILVDAGATYSNPDSLSAARPSAAKRPGQWIARYVQRQLLITGRTGLDYLVVTHLHPDHLGDIGENTPPSQRGNYLLTGVTDVAEELPIGLVLDRGHPRYTYPIKFPAGFAKNYEAFIAARTAAGENSAEFKAGADDQIVLRHAPERYASFHVRNIAVNGAVWTGSGNASSSAVPPLETLPRANYPDENMCSIAFKLTYGKFDFFTGGDLAADTADDTMPWRDIETPAARAAGPVEVAVANHHGYFDAVGKASVRLLQPTIWIVPAWHVTHPGMAPLQNMLSERLYPGKRHVFIADLAPAAALVNRRFLSQVASQAGHVVVRVSPGGAQYQVFVTDNTDEADQITASFGPFDSQ